MKLGPHFKTSELLGECLLKAGKPLDAILYLAASAGLGNNNFRAEFLLAQAFLAVDGKYDAVSHLKKAIQMNPSYKSAKELFATLSADDEFRRLIAHDDEG